MFKRLFGLWHDEDLLQQAYSDAAAMLALAQEQFKKAISPLLMGAPTDADTVYSMDRKINAHEIEIRRKVMEHLSIAPKQDTTAALVLTTIAIDIERIGDYGKNFFELWQLYGAAFCRCPIFDRISEIYSNVVTMFELTLKAFSDADAEIARKVMDAHIFNAKNCDEIVAALVRMPIGADELAPNQEVLAALSARYLKRASAHLKNIASSVVNPFDRIGFKPPENADFCNTA